MTNRILRYSGLGLAVLTVGAMAACGSNSDNSGTPAAAGTSAGGASSGGSAGTLTTAGSNDTLGGSANTAGSAGSAGTGTGGGGGAGSGFACAGTVPASPLITEFADLVPNAMSVGNYTFLAGVPGGTFSYQAGALTLASTDMALTVTGNVKAYDGFGVYFTTCTNASAYTGVSFNIKGYAGPTGKLNFRVQTNATTAIDTTNSKGSCVTTPGAADTYPECHPSGFDIQVTGAATEVSVNFSQLIGGVPIAAVTGNDILGLEWAFLWDPAAATAAGGASAGGAGGAATSGAGGTSAGGAGGAAAGPYDANITIDNIKFIGGPAAGGAAGAGAGAGGASAGTGGITTSGGASGAGGARAGSGGTGG